MGVKLQLLLLYMIVAAVTGYELGCQYQLNQCYGRLHDIEQKVNQVDAKLNIMENRQGDMTQAISKEVTVLDRDIKTIKSVANTLVEDNVRMHGDIRELKGHGEAIVGLRRQVSSVKQVTEGELTSVKSKMNQLSQSLSKESEAFNKVTTLMSSQMNNNNHALKELMEKATRLETKINQVEENAGSSGLSDVQGMVDELTSRLDSMQEQIQEFSKKLANSLKK